MAIKQISVFAENKKGTAFGTLDILADAGVDIRALSIAETTEYGILRFIVADVEKASQLLKNSGTIVTVTNVIAVQMPDTPGGLAGILGVLSNAGINIEYLYAFVATVKGHACVVLRVQDNEEAESVLVKNGMTLLTDADVNTL